MAFTVRSDMVSLILPSGHVLSRLRVAAGENAILVGGN